MKMFKLFAAFAASLLVFSSCEEEKAEISSLTLDKTTLEMNIGETSKLTATVKPDALADTQISWSSSDAKIAKVSEDGTVTAIAAGAAEITASAEGKSAVCNVTVKSQEPEKPSATAIKLSKVFTTQYNAGKGMDTYNIILSDGNAVFDDVTGLIHTEKSGWAMVISLNTASAADPSKPELPEGKYTLDSNLKPGIWNSDKSVNYITFNSDKNEVSKVIPATGEIEVKKTTAGYILNATFKGDDQKDYTATYNGGLSFPGVEAKPIELSFIGGSATYKGVDISSNKHYMQVELWDYNREGSYGNLMTFKLYIPEVDGTLASIPSGKWEFSNIAGDNVAEPGFANTEDGIPSGSYLTQTSDETTSPKYSMLYKGTITITEDKHVIVDTYTEDRVHITGKLNQPLELVENGGGEGPAGVSTLKSDKVINMPDVKFAYCEHYGESAQIHIIDKKNQYAVILMLTLPSNTPGTTIPDGTYKADKDGTSAEYTFTTGGGDPESSMTYGTWGFMKIKDWDGIYIKDFSEAGNAVDGSIDVKRSGDKYTFTFDLKDDAKTPHKITGSWTGTLNTEEYSPLS